MVVMITCNPSGDIAHDWQFAIVKAYVDKLSVGVGILLNVTP